MRQPLPERHLVIKAPSTKNIYGVHERRDMESGWRVFCSQHNIKHSSKGTDNGNRLNSFALSPRTYLVMVCTAVLRKKIGWLLSSHGAVAFYFANMSPLFIGIGVLVGDADHFT